MSLVADSSTLEATVRSLAGFTAERAPITTCYLDVDGRRHPRHVDVERRAELLLRTARARLNGAAADPSVETDLRRIADWIRAGFDRSRTRGLAVFACAAHDLFEVVPLPVPVHDRVVVNHVPALGQLESVLQDHEPIGVLLADRQRARMLVFELGELTERSELFERTPAGDPGHQDRGDLNAAIEAATATHLRHAASVAWRAWQERHFAHLAIGAPDAVAGSLESLLHPYQRERVCGRMPVEVGAGLAEIRAAALDVEHAVDRAREAALVDRLRAAVASGARGVAGLGPVLSALNERRVERLLLSEGYEEEGWRCPDSGALAEVGPTSPVTGGRMDKVLDVVEDAIELALNQGCKVDVCVGNADLDVLGRIGALLRY